MASGSSWTHPREHKEYRAVFEHPDTLIRLAQEHRRALLERAARERMLQLTRGRRSTFGLEWWPAVRMRVARVLTSLPEKILPEDAVWPQLRDYPY
jgi:hypothetical protein